MLAAADRRWLILADGADGSVGAALAGLVTGRGGRAVVATAGAPGAALSATGADRFELDPADPAAMDELVAAALTGGGLDDVVHLWTLDDAAWAPARASGRGPHWAAPCTSTQALVDRGVARAPTWFVTRGAQAVGGTAPDPEQALLWGFARSVGPRAPRAAPAVHRSRPRRRP